APEPPSGTPSSPPLGIAPLPLVPLPPAWKLGPPAKLSPPSDMSPPQLGQACLVGRTISSLPQLNESAETKTTRHASTQNRVACMRRRIVVEKPKHFYAGTTGPLILLKSTRFLGRIVKSTVTL